MKNNTEQLILDYYKDAIIYACALCDHYKISYENYFKEKYLYEFAYLFKETKDSHTHYIYNEKWQFMRVYIELYDKYKNLTFGNKKFLKCIKQIKDTIKQLDALFNNDIIYLSEHRKELKRNEKKKKDNRTA